MPAPPPGAGQRWRGSLLTAFLVGVVWIFCLRTPAVWEIAGLGRDEVPFLDLHGSLAAGELARSGGDPYAINPLDVSGRPHLYSRWWLVTGDLGLTRADAVWLGSGLLAAVLLATLLILRPATNRQIALSVLLLISPAWLLAANRANNDLVIFLLVAGALAAVRSTATLPRLAAAGLLALATILKYFPAVTALLLLEARSRREAWSTLLIAGALLALGWSSLQPALEAALRFLPQPSGFYTFG
ncbi:MAG TPA: glycosyltransferase 87 family protein, partial [Opitutaceae bacterium]